MSPRSNIGRSLIRTDAVQKVRGLTKFLPDLDQEGLWHAVPLFAAVARGRLMGIHYDAIRSDPEFVAVFTADDIPGQNEVGVIIEDQPLMVAEQIRYLGDTVGVLVARSTEAAERLAREVGIEVEALQPFYSIDESRDATGNFIHQTNLACTHQVDRGDINAGFEDAAHVIEAHFSTPTQEHYYLEPQGCIVRPDHQGGLFVTGSLQCPYYVQKAVAKSLGLPYSQVRVEQAATGGAFGGKEDVPSEVCARTALAAHLLNHPIRMVYSRATDIQITSKRHPFQMHYKVGVSADGKLIAAEILLEENAGAYATLSSVVSYRSTMQAMGPYVIPNIKVRSNSYYTNLPPNGAFRGFGSPQAAFGHERMMDHIAAEIGMDPIELRLKNVVRLGTLTLTGHKLTSSVGAEETLKQAAARAQADPCIRTDRQDGRYLHGTGVSLIHYGNCLGAAGWAMDGSGAKLQIHRDGSISVAFGLVEMGQGALTVVTQMTAEALGVSPEQIQVLQPDTHQVPDSGPAVASRNVVMTGNAIRDAAEKLTPVILSAAADLLSADAGELTLGNGLVRDPRSGKQLNFAEITEHLFLTNRPMESVGWWHVPPLEYDPEKGIGEAYFTYSYATHIASVRVDTLTGRVHVNKIWAAHDIGRAINPAGIEAQVEGGAAQGVGWALSEDFRYEDGRVVADNLSTYLIPTADDVGVVETIIVEDPEPLGPWGAKGIGEPAIIPTAAALANAVSRALGKQVDHLPIRPETVLDLLQE